MRRLARAAVVGGGMYAVGRHSANRAAEEREQEARLNALEYSAAAPPPAYAPATSQDVSGSPPDRVAQLQQLATLRDGGVLTEPEFDAEKRRILGS